MSESNLLLLPPVRAKRGRPKLPRDANGKVIRPPKPGSLKKKAFTPENQPTPEQLAKRVRSKHPDQVARHAQRALPIRERMQILASIARDPSVKPAERTAAIKEMNDRHMGKAKEVNTLNLKTNAPVSVAIIPKIENKKEPEPTEEEKPNDV